MREKEKEGCYKRLNVGGKIGLLDYYKIQFVFEKSLRTHAILKIPCVLEC